MNGPEIESVLPDSRSKNPSKTSDYVTLTVMAKQNINHEHLKHRFGCLFGLGPDCTVRSCKVTD